MRKTEETTRLREKRKREREREREKELNKRRNFKGKSNFQIGKEGKNSLSSASKTRSISPSGCQLVKVGESVPVIQSFADAKRRRKGQVRACFDLTCPVPRPFFERHFAASRAQLLLSSPVELRATRRRVEVGVCVFRSQLNLETISPRAGTREKSRGRVI